MALAACADTPPPAALSPESEAEQGSVLAMLRTLDTVAFDEAYARLEEREYRVALEVSQLDAGGEPVATTSRTYLVTPDTPLLVDERFMGSFEFGGFEAFADTRRDMPAFTANPTTLVLDEDPPYLDPRGAEVFTFAFAGDTLLGDRPVRILSVTARPEENDQPLRAAHLYVATTGALIGARIVRRQESILFKESSTTSLFLQPAPEGWLPDRLTTEATIQAPLTDTRRFRLDERYTFPE